MCDPFDLSRFVYAQEPVIDEVLAELTEGRKRGHWMWFIFPQLRGLGHSPTAIQYGIAGVDEAEAYLQHPILGPRLEQCTGLVNLVEATSASDIFGGIDSIKFRSCMTLFAHASTKDSIYETAIDKYFDGQGDRLTIERLTSPF